MITQEVDALHLPLMEDFYTIQGEGVWQGNAAYFIRLAGCNVGCVWCDVKESWNPDAHPVVSVSEMTNRALRTGCNRVVVTGGEPVMYDLAGLTEALQAAGLRTHLETSGAYPITGTWDWICLSPKKFKAPHPSTLHLAHELKVIVFNKSDFSWAEEFAAKVSAHCQLFLQPEWSRQNEMIAHIINYVKNNPRWRISLQVHKFMNIP